jgi:NAD(P)-dependent dehydrogenase (short-subunit alcohol dehydrogenase family)
MITNLMQYPSQYCPIYSASKAGVVNFMRAVAFPFHHYDGIRTYAICPGTVRTNLLSGEEWKAFPEEYFTPTENVSSAVELLVEGGQLKDAWGRTVEHADSYGLAVEIIGSQIYFRDQPDYCNDAMKNILLATSMEYQVGRFHAPKTADGS